MGKKKQTYWVERKTTKKILIIRRSLLDKINFYGGISGFLFIGIMVFGIIFGSFTQIGKINLWILRILSLLTGIPAMITLVILALTNEGSIQTRP